MKVLFVTAGSQATVFALGSLATAVRTAGHEVFMTANTDMVPAIADLGFPAVSVTGRPLREFVIRDRAGRPVAPPAGDPASELRFTGAWFGRLAAASLGALVELAADWRPDLIVGGALSYAAPLLAARLDVPCVRQAIDTTDTTGIDPGAGRELAPELAELGLDRLPRPDLSVEICPAALRPPEHGPVQLMRWIPANRQRRLEPWMYAAASRRRVCVTLGSRVALKHDLGLLAELTRAVAALDVEVLVAAPDSAVTGLRDELPQIRAGWIPLDVVAPTCDLIVHHGGGVTSMTALTAGVPQLILSEGAYAAMPAARLAAAGAAISLPPAGHTPQDLRTACRELLSGPAHRAVARELARELAALPLPAEVAGVLEKLEDSHG